MRRRLKPLLKPKKCRLCKKEFAPNTVWQKYCSALCRFTIHNRRRFTFIRKAKLAERARMKRYLAEPQEPEQDQLSVKQAAQ